MLKFDERDVPEQKKATYDRLMSGSRTPVYVLGRNKYAQRVSRCIAVQGFVDDFTSEKEYMGRPVIRMGELPGQCIVVSCVIDTVPVTGIDRLRTLGVRNVIDFFSLSRLNSGIFGEVDCCARNRDDILHNRSEYEWVYARLADEVSKRHFEKVVQFRLSFDLEHMRGFTLAIDRQYFEDFLPPEAGAVFVDGGGFDGQTTLQFAAKYPAYRRIYYFEPIPAMMDVSRGNLNGLRDVCLVQKGLFSRHDRMCFDAQAGPASAISPNGQSEIEVVRLDDEVREPVSFLKLDIEGAEHEAIHGAADHIRLCSATMAVCIYHDQRDFWRVPKQVLEINSRYKVFVRHYSESIRETVMFFVPDNSRS